MDIDLPAESWQVLLAFALYLVGVAALGVFAHRYLTRGSFVKEYFLGNRGLGPWVLALTVAATSISGGTFMGFPSLIYTNGWVMALWICSYMVVPLTTMALMAKRINQVARLSGSVTVPDVLRDRFHSPSLGIVATLLILGFLIVNLIGQFKAGGLVMKEALRLRPAPGQLLLPAEIDRQTLVLTFAREDGKQQIQKLPLPWEQARIRALEDLSETREIQVTFALPGGDQAIRKAPYPAAKVFFFQPLFRADTKEKFLVLTFVLNDGARDTQKVILPHEKATVRKIEDDPDTREVLVTFILPGGANAIKKVSYPAPKAFFFLRVDKGYLIGLFIFALTVVAYTTYGGFWAVTWTDVLEGLVMLVGVIILAILAVQAVQPYNGSTGLAAATERLRDLKVQGSAPASLVYGPGPAEFLSLGLAFSFFLMWSLMAAGQPSGMVRQMSFKDSPSLRRALLLVCGYYLITYLCLLVIFICARAIFPTEYLREMGSEGQPDSIMPAMVRRVADPVVAGLLLAAPYAAIMSTVAAFLLMISSSLVRDLYQRTINPDASPRTLKVFSYLVTALVGAIVVLGALNPPDYLQDIIVFTGAGQGCSFLVPMVMLLYWRRATRQGVLASMLGGFLAVLSLYLLGWLASAGWIPGLQEEGKIAFKPYYLGGVDPLVWGLLASLVLGIAVSLWTRPEEELVKKYFPAQG